jgi:hypothetical protein
MSDSRQLHQKVETCSNDYLHLPLVIAASSGFLQYQATITPTKSWILPSLLEQTMVQKALVDVWRLELMQEHRQSALDTAR